MPSGQGVVHEPYSRRAKYQFPRTLCWKRWHNAAVDSAIWV
jgi:hypothetical protein